MHLTRQSSIMKINFGFLLTLEMMKEKSSNDELFLFYADKLETTDWISHPLNPIISDPSKSRSAGKIISRDNELYRPSQDCSKHYGHRIKINKIIKMNETEYVEKEVSSINPNWHDSIISTHTYNKEGDLHIIDAKFRSRRFF